MSSLNFRQPKSNCENLDFFGFACLGQHHVVFMLAFFDRNEVALSVALVSRSASKTLIKYLQPGQLSQSSQSVGRKPLMMFRPSPPPICHRSETVVPLRFPADQSEECDRRVTHTHYDVDPGKNPRLRFCRPQLF